MTPNKEKKECNYMQVGQISACGHCDPKRFGEGLKEAEKAIPNLKCDCLCHSDPLTSLLQSIAIETAERIVVDYANFSGRDDLLRAKIRESAIRHITQALAYYKGKEMR